MMSLSWPENLKNCLMSKHLAGDIHGGKYLLEQCGRIVNFVKLLGLDNFH